MHRLIVAGIAAQCIAFSAVAQTAPPVPAGPAPNTSIPEITAKDTAKLPSIEAVAPSKTNTGMTTAPTPTPADSKPLPVPPASGAGITGANALTQTQAIKLIEAAGFSHVTGLTKDKEGVWRGKADKGSGQVMVAVDDKGNVATQ